MIAMDEIRSSEYCTDFWFRSGVSHFRRAHAVDWMSKVCLHLLKSKHKMISYLLYLICILSCKGTSNGQTMFYTQPLIC